MTTTADALAEAAERFPRDTADHQLTVLHDDGLYRHLRFQAPGTSLYWFDLVTWPGHLSFTGEVDGYTFAAGATSDHENEFPGLADAVQGELLGDDSDVDLSIENTASEALEAFRFRSDGTGKEFRFAHTWDWDLGDYDWTFLWACHAIVWGISQYDAARPVLGSAS